MTKHHSESIATEQGEFTDEQKAVLQELIDYCDARGIGYPESAFKDFLCEMGITRWLQFLQPLCTAGLMRRDSANGFRREAVFKPLKKAYVILKRI